MGNFADLAQRTMSGSHGELWWNGELLAQTYKFEAKVEIKKEQVGICGDMWEHQKVMSLSGRGTVGIHKVDSAILSEFLANARSGRFPTVTIISNLADPDAFGNERVVVKNVSLDGITVANWEYGVAGKIDESFTFSGMPELIDEVVQ